LTDIYYNEIVPDHVPADRIHDYDIYDYQNQDPFLAAHKLLEDGVPEIFWTRNNGGHWIITGAAGITEVDRNTTIFSTERMFVPEVQNPDPPFFIPNQADPPEHGVLRGIINPLFAPNRIALLQEKIRAMSIEKIEAIRERGECEFVTDYAGEFPVIIFLSLTDLPEKDRFKLRAIAHRILDPSGDTNRSAPIEDLVNYLAPVIEDRMVNPRDDVFSQILQEGIRNRGLTRDTAVRLVATVLMGGLDTVTAALTYLARHLAENPVDRRRLIDEPDMIPRAVEEVLRRYPVSNIGRQLKTDAAFRGVEMRRNDHIVWSIAMHNLDKRAYTDPLQIDFDRKKSQHSTFGGGIHFCPGATLARTELRTFTETWLARIPDFHVRPGADIRYRNGHTITLRELPLVIGPAV
jgi:camphor 5-monooxygenase